MTQSRTTTSTPTPKRHRRLPKGAGAVNCLMCKAHAAAKGDGSPIVLKCIPACPTNSPHYNTANPPALRNYTAEIYYAESHTSEDVELRAPSLGTAMAMFPQVLERDYLPDWVILRIFESG